MQRLEMGSQVLRARVEQKAGSAKLSSGKWNTGYTGAVGSEEEERNQRRKRRRPLYLPLPQPLFLAPSLPPIALLVSVSPWSVRLSSLYFGGGSWEDLRTNDTERRINRKTNGLLAIDFVCFVLVFARDSSPLETASISGVCTSFVSCHGDRKKPVHGVEAA